MFVQDHCRSEKPSSPSSSFIKARRSAVGSAESTMRRQSELMVFIQRWSSAAVEGSTAADSRALLECASCIAVSRSSCSRASSCSRSSFRCVFDTNCETGLLARLASKPIPKRPNTYEEYSSLYSMYKIVVYSGTNVKYSYSMTFSERNENWAVMKIIQRQKKQISNKLQRIRK